MDNTITRENIKNIHLGAVTWMLLTYKIKHNRNFSEELRKARKVAEFCMKYQTQNRSLNPPPIQKPVSSDSYFSVSSLDSSFSSSLSSSLSSSKVPHDSRTAFSASPSLDSLPVYDTFPNSRSPALQDVKHIGLKSIISCQILRKYSQIQNLKSAENVKLIIPSRAVNVDKNERTLLIPCLKLLLNYHFSNNFKKISQIEIDSIYAYVAVVFSGEQARVQGTI